MELEIGLRSAPIEFKPAKRDALRRRGTAHFCVGHNAFAVTDGSTFTLLGVDGREPRLSKSVAKWRENVIRFRMSSLGTFATGIDDIGFLATWHVQIDSYIVRTIPLSLLQRINPALNNRSKLRKTLEQCSWVWISDDGCCQVACFPGGQMLGWTGSHWDAKGRWSFLELPLLLSKAWSSNMLFPAIEVDTVDNDSLGRGLVLAQSRLDMKRQAVEVLVHTIATKASCGEPRVERWNFPLPASCASDVSVMRAWLKGRRKRSRPRGLKQRTVLGFDGTRTLLAVGLSAICRSKKSTGLPHVCLLYVFCTTTGTHWSVNVAKLVTAASARSAPLADSCLPWGGRATAPRQVTVDSLQWVASDLLLVVLLNTGHLLIFSKTGIPLRVRPSPALAALSSQLSAFAPVGSGVGTTARLAATPTLAPWQQRDSSAGERFLSGDMSVVDAPALFPWAVPLFCDMVPPGAAVGHADPCCSLALHATQADLLVRIGHALINLRLPAVLAAPRQICRPTPHLFYSLSGHPTLPSGQSRSYTIKTLSEGTFAESMKPWFGLKKLISAGWKVARNFRILGTESNRTDMRQGAVTSPTLRPRGPDDGRYGLRGSIDPAPEAGPPLSTTASLARRRSSSFIDEEGSVSGGGGGPVDVSLLPEGAAGVAGVHRVLPTTALPDAASVPARLFSPPIGSTALAQAPLCLIPQPLLAEALVYEHAEQFSNAYAEGKSDDVSNPQAWRWSLGLPDTGPGLVIPWTTDMGISLNVASQQSPSESDDSPLTTGTSLKSPLLMLSPSSRPSHTPHGRDIVVSTPFRGKSPSSFRSASPRLGGKLSLSTRLELWASHLARISPPPTPSSASEASQEPASPASVRHHALDQDVTQLSYRRLKSRVRRRRSSAPGRPADPFTLSTGNSDTFSFAIEDIVASEVRSSTSDPSRPPTTHRRDRSSSLELIPTRSRRTTTHRSQLSYLLAHTDQGGGVPVQHHADDHGAGADGTEESEDVDVYKPVLRAQKSLRSPWEPETPLLSRLSAVASPSASRGRFGWAPGAGAAGRALESASARRAAMAEAASLSAVLEGGQWLGEGKQGASWGNAVTSDKSVLARGSSVRGGSVLGSWDAGVFQVWPPSWTGSVRSLQAAPRRDREGSGHISVGLEAATLATSLRQLSDTTRTAADVEGGGNPLPLANSEVMCNMLPTSRGSLSPALMLALTAIACISVGRPFLATAGLRLVHEEEEEEEAKYGNRANDGFSLPGAPASALTAWSLVQGQGHGSCGVDCIPWQTLLVQTGIRAVVADTLRVIAGLPRCPLAPIPWTAPKFKACALKHAERAYSLTSSAVLSSIGSGLEMLWRSGGGSPGALLAAVHAALLRLGVEGDAAAAEALLCVVSSRFHHANRKELAREWLRVAALYWTLGCRLSEDAQYPKELRYATALRNKGKQLLHRVAEDAPAVPQALLRYLRLVKLFGSVPRTFLASLPPTARAPYADSMLAPLQAALKLPVVSSLAATSGHWLWVGNRASLSGQWAEAALAYQQAGPVGLLPLLYTYLHCYRVSEALQIVDAATQLLSLHAATTPLLQQQASATTLHDIPEDAERLERLSASPEGPDARPRSPQALSQASRPSSASSPSHSPGSSASASSGGGAGALPPSMSPFIEAVVLAYAQYYVGVVLGAKLEVDLWNGHSFRAHACASRSPNACIAVPQPHAAYSLRDSVTRPHTSQPHATRLLLRSRCLQALALHASGSGRFMLEALAIAGAWRPAGVVMALLLLSPHGSEDGAAGASLISAVADALTRQQDGADAAHQLVCKGIQEGVYYHCTAVPHQKLHASLRAMAPAFKLLRKHFLEPSLEFTVWHRFLQHSLDAAWRAIDASPLLARPRVFAQGSASQQARLARVASERQQEEDGATASEGPRVASLTLSLLSHLRDVGIGGGGGGGGGNGGSGGGSRSLPSQRSTDVRLEDVEEKQESALLQLISAAWLCVQRCIDLAAIDSKALFSSALSLSASGASPSRAAQSHEYWRLRAAVRGLLTLTWLQHVRCDTPFWVAAATNPQYLNARGFWAWRRPRRDQSAHTRAWLRVSTAAMSHLVAAARVLTSRNARRATPGRDETMAAMATAASVIARGGLANHDDIVVFLAWGAQAEAAMAHGHAAASYIRRLRMAIANAAEPPRRRAPEEVLRALVADTVRPHVSILRRATWHVSPTKAAVAMTPSADTPRRRSVWVQLSNTLETTFQETSQKVSEALDSEASAFLNMVSSMDSLDYDAADDSSSDNLVVSGVSADTWASLASYKGFLAFCCDAMATYFPPSSVPSLCTPARAHAESHSPRRRSTDYPPAAPQQAPHLAMPLNGSASAPEHGEVQVHNGAEAPAKKIKVPSLYLDTSLHQESKSQSYEFRQRSEPRNGRSGGSRGGLKGGGKPSEFTTEGNPYFSSNLFSHLWKQVEKDHSSTQHRRAVLDPFLHQERKAEHPLPRAAASVAAPAPNTEPPRQSPPTQAESPPSPAPLHSTQHRQPLSPRRLELESEESGYMTLLRRSHKARARAARLRLLQARESVQESLQQLQRSRRITDAVDARPPADAPAAPGGDARAAGADKGRVPQERTAASSQAAAVNAHLHAEPQGLQPCAAEADAVDYGDVLLQSRCPPCHAPKTKEAAPAPRATTAPRRPTRSDIAPLNFLPPLVLASEGEAGEEGPQHAHTVQLPRGLKRMQQRSPEDGFPPRRVSTHDRVLQELDLAGCPGTQAQGAGRKAPPVQRVARAPACRDKKRRSKPSAGAPRRTGETKGWTRPTVIVPPAAAPAQPLAGAAPDTGAIAEVIAAAVADTFSSFLSSPSATSVPVSATAAALNETPAPVKQQRPPSPVEVVHAATSPIRSMPTSPRSPRVQKVFLEHQSTQTDPRKAPSPPFPLAHAPGFASPVFLGVTDLDELSSDEDDVQEENMAPSRQTPQFSPVDASTPVTPGKPQAAAAMATPFEQPSFLVHSPASSPPAVEESASIMDKKAVEGKAGEKEEKEEKEEEEDSATSEARTPKQTAEATAVEKEALERGDVPTPLAASPVHAFRENQQPATRTEAAAEGEEQSASSQHGRSQGGEEADAESPIAVPNVSDDFQARLRILEQALQEAESIANEAEQEAAETRETLSRLMLEADEEKYQETHARVTAAFAKVDAMLGRLYEEEGKEEEATREVWSAGQAAGTAQRDWDIGACAAQAYELSPRAEAEGVPAKPWHVLRPAALRQRKTYHTQGRPGWLPPKVPGGVAAPSPSSRKKDTAMMRGIWDTLNTLEEQVSRPQPNKQPLVVTTRGIPRHNGPQPKVPIAQQVPQELSRPWQRGSSSGPWVMGFASSDDPSRKRASVQRSRYQTRDGA